MKITFNIQLKYKEPEIVICAEHMTDDISRIGDEISRIFNQTLVGYQKSEATVLRLEDIVRIYAENQKVMAQTKDKIYSLHLKLYELERELDNSRFVRISKSEIVNIKKIQRIDMSVVGTIKIHLFYDIVTYVSRRNIPLIKNDLCKEE